MRDEINILQEKPSSKFTLKEIRELFGFTLKDSRDILRHVSTDSRLIKPDEIFLPLSGEKYDGHDFINDVLGKKGCLYSFCEDKKINKVQDLHRDKLIVVESALDAYHKLANHYRKKVNPKVIGITGSSGKTTVKDLISSVLSVKYKTHKTKANFNNEIGVPKTILEMREDTEVLVLELAMRGKGQIRQLAKVCEPDIAVITNVGTAHIGLLGSKESIIKAKCEILEFMKHDGLAILPEDCRDAACRVSAVKKIFLNIGQASNIRYEKGETHFKFDGEDFFVPALGKIHVLNSIIAILTAQSLNLSYKEIQKGLSDFKVPAGRGEIIKIKDGVYIIDESYNANPDSVKEAAENLTTCWDQDKSHKKILVLGELAELGEHRGNLLKELNRQLGKSPDLKVITVGSKLNEVTIGENVPDTSTCCAILETLLTPKTVVLIKGSRAAGLEKVVEYCKCKCKSKE